jgi:hypothetical protein
VSPIIAQRAPEAIDLSMGHGDNIRAYPPQGVTIYTTPMGMFQIRAPGWLLQLLQCGRRGVETRDKSAVFRTGQTLLNDGQHGRQIIPDQRRRIEP